jgi:hypothetical protein
MCCRRRSPFEQSRPHLRGCGIEKDLVVLLGQGLVEIGRPALDAVLLRERRRLVCIAADQDRIGHDAVAVRKSDATLRTDRENGADQVLIGPHPAGDPIHDDSETSRRHDASSLNSLFWYRSAGRIRAGGRFMASLQPQSAGKARAASRQY